MNLRILTLKYFGWCPGKESATEFRVSYSTPNFMITNFRIIFFLFLALTGLFIFVPYSFYGIGRLTGPRYNQSTGYWIIATFFIMVFSLWCTYKWFKPLFVKDLRATFRSVLLVGAIVHSLSLIWTNSLDPYIWNYRLLTLNFAPSTLQSYSHLVSILSGFVLLRLSSKYIEKNEFDAGKIKLSSIFLALLSLSGLTFMASLNWNNLMILDSLQLSAYLATLSAYLATGLFGLYLLTSKKFPSKAAYTVLFLWLITPIFEYLVRVYYQALSGGLTLLSAVQNLFRSSSFYSLLTLPSPGVFTVFLVVAGLILHRFKKTSPRKLGYIYSAAIITFAVTNLISFTRFPIIFKDYVTAYQSLVNSGDLVSSLGFVPLSTWYHFFLGLEGVIILTFGVLSIKETRSNLAVKRVYPKFSRGPAILTSRPRKILALTIGTISILSIGYIILPSLGPSVIVSGTQYTADSFDEYKPRWFSSMEHSLYSRWDLLGHYEDQEGDQIAPYLSSEGVALGGLSYIGTDILNVTLSSPFLSDELIVTVQLNGSGISDPTIDKDNTVLDIDYSYLMSESYRGARYTYSGQSRRGGDHSYRTLGDNLLEITFDKLPLLGVLDEIRVSTYLQTDAGELYLDTLKIRGFSLGRGRTLSVIDSSKHYAPLTGSIMSGMDIKDVDLYRSGDQLVVTVNFSDSMVFDDSIPNSSDYRICDIRFTRGGYSVHPDRTSSGLYDEGNRYIAIYDLSDLSKTEDLSSYEVKIKTRARFPTIIDTTTETWEETSFAWYFDTFSIPFNLKEEFQIESKSLDSKFIYLDDFTVLQDNDIILQDSISPESFIDSDWGPNRYGYILDRASHSPPYSIALTCTKGDFQTYGSLSSKILTSSDWETVNITWYMMIPEVRWPLNELFTDFNLRFLDLEDYTGHSTGRVGFDVVLDLDGNDSYAYMDVMYWGEDLPSNTNNHVKKTIQVEMGTWYRISILVSGNHVTFFFNGENVGEVSIHSEHLGDGISFQWRAFLST